MSQTLDISKTPKQEVIDTAIDVLKKGGMVVYPTETCYGLGVDVTNKKAVEKLFKYKSRREGKPISIAVCDEKMASGFVEINEVAQNLYDNYLPGPITVVSKGLGKVAPGIESEFSTLGIRIPDYELMLEIIKKFGKPISTTSANISYKPKPYSIESLIKNTPPKYLKLVDLFLDGGKLPYRETSTVVDTTLNNLIVMREGCIALEKDTKASKPLLEAKTKSAEETISFGGFHMLKFIDDRLEYPLVFLLSGELGTGKTQFTKGVAKELRIPNIIKSPTYTILNEYPFDLARTRGQLVHIDTWRIENLKDLQTIGLERYLAKGNVIVIEWADKFYNDLIPLLKKFNSKVFNVVFEYVDENTRDIKTFKKI